MKTLGKKAIVWPMFLVIFELVLLAMIGIAEQTYINRVKDSNIYEKKYLAPDIGLLMNTIYTANSNILYDYSHPMINLAQFEIGLAKNSVAINPFMYEPAASKAVELVSGIHKDAGTINFIRIGNKITTLADPDLANKDSAAVKNKLFTLQCPGIKAKIKGAIALDAGHGGTDKGIEAEGFTEQEFSRQLAYMLYQFGAVNLPSPAAVGQTIQLNPRFVVTRALEGELAAETTAEQRARIINSDSISAVLSIHAGTHKSPDENFVKAYVNIHSKKLTESRVLACTILNKFIEEFDQLTGVSIAGVNLQNMEDNSQFMVLAPEKTAVLIEIGNANSKNNFLQKRQQIASLIYNAIKEHME